MSDDIEFTATARETDRALARIDGRIDWLSYLTPTHLDAGAEGFRDSGYKVLPELEYPPIPDDLGALRSQLLDLPMRQLGNLDIEALLIEKQRELDRQIGDDARRRRATLEGDQIGERLHRRSRRMRRPCAVDLTAVAGEEITRTGECEHRAGGVFDHDDGSMGDVAAFERLQSL